MADQTRFVLTAHAGEVVEARGIRREWIRRVLEAPKKKSSDKADRTLKHYLGVVAEYDDRVLRIVVDDRKTPVRVITAYFDRAMRGKL